MTQREASDACGVVLSTFRRWEAGEAVPQSRAHRVLVAAFLGLQPTTVERILR